jgi:hypothetical protein
MKKKAIAFVRNAGRLIRSKASIAAVTLAGAASVASATDTPPLDLSSAGTTIAGYGTTGAGYALPIFVLLVGLGVLMRGFMKVGGRK